ncbi:MAG: hypothetical protein ABIH70_00505 [Chloroflexota bacterium]
MIRGLKVVLIVYGAAEILLGLASILAPYTVGQMFGLGEIESYVPYLMAMFGGALIAVSVGFIFAGLDPLRNIPLVKLAILWSLLGVVTQLYSVIQGAVDFSQAGTGIIMDAVFAALFLAFYPYRQLKAES